MMLQCSSHGGSCNASVSGGSSASALRCTHPQMPLDTGQGMPGSCNKTPHHHVWLAARGHPPGLSLAQGGKTSSSMHTAATGRAISWPGPVW